MAELQVRSLSGEMKALSEATIEAFSGGIRGALMKPDDAGYDDAPTDLECDDRSATGHDCAM